MASWLEACLHPALQPSQPHIHTLAHISLHGQGACARTAEAVAPFMVITDVLHLHCCFRNARMLYEAVCCSQAYAGHTDCQSIWTASGRSRLVHGAALVLGPATCSLPGALTASQTLVDKMIFRRRDAQKLAPSASGPACAGWMRCRHRICAIWCGLQ